MSATVCNHDGLTGGRPASLDRSTLHREPSELDAYLEKKCDVAAEDAVPEAVPLHCEDDFPDGGLQAWLVVVGAMCVTFSTFGYVNTWGAFQEYYENVMLPDSSPSTIAWIGSIQYSLVFLPALVVGRLFDLGHFRYPLSAATVLMVVCTFLTAECTQYWQFLLCQGFGIGLSSGIIFGPTMGIVAHWFKKKRSTALGVIACGSSVGGTAFPIAFRNLSVSVGFKWTMRIFGFILLCSLGAANILLKRRLPPTHVSGGLLNLKQFRMPAYSVYTASGFVAFLGLYTVLTYIDASAPSQGVTGDLPFYLISIANVGSGFGRLASGFAADRVGPLTVMTPFTLLAGVLTFIWPFVRGYSLIPVAIIYGASSGAFAGLLAAPMMAFGDTADVGRRTGMFMTILSFGALAGPPISGAINTASGGYKAVGVYAGSSIMLASAMLFTSRYLVLGGIRGKI
ncbi:MFS general substrate transporter [Auriscalpium vulgare]|uniref:MFS general substrate transporter n=1 Tax=Auriscalpium vulgare TaxID=40419 RepID=A0ACB8S2Y4_9AGAM|nr:MFS general substrate transporter [Auriscalpium vulgare]